jgi:hypothetical protein
MTTEFNITSNALNDRFVPPYSAIGEVVIDAASHIVCHGKDSNTARILAGVLTAGWRMNILARMKNGE